MALERRSGLCYSFGTLLLVASAAAPAMSPLEDEEMAAFTGQDGISINIDAGSQISAEEIEWRMDDATPQSAALLIQDLQASLQSGPGFTGAGFEVDVGGDGADGYLVVRGSWSGLQARIGALGHSFYRDNAPLVLGEPDRTVDRSVGIFGIESTGSLTMGGVSGLLNYGNPADPSTAQSVFDLTSQGEVFYRQSTGFGAPEISFGQLDFGFRFTDGAGNPGLGRFGIYNDRLTIAGDNLDFDLNFDLFFAPSTVTEFDKASRLPMIVFGWEGGIENAEISIGSGGIGTGSSVDASIPAVFAGLQYFNYEGQYGTRTQGLNIDAQWDYSEDFRFILGQASGDRIRVDFFDWRRMGAGTAGEAAYDFRLPIILDAIGPGAGAGGLCFGGSLPSSGSLTSASCGVVGGQFYNVPPKDSALAVVIRDGGLHAYNTQALVNDVDGFGTPVVDRFNWSLLYTFGKIDANLYFYPDGGYDAVTDKYAGALRSDVLLTIQSPGYWRAAQANFDPAVDPGIDPNARARWATNTHFLVADTDINKVAVGLNPSQAQLDAREEFGIGILNADLLWRVDDFVISLVGNTPAPTADPNSSDFYVSNADIPGVWLQSDNLARYQFRGLFGGGNLNDLSDPARISLIDVNIETDQFIFVLGPPRLPGEEYVAFDALLNFTGGNPADIFDGAYLTLAEPSQPSAFVGLTNVDGRIAWTDGRVQLSGNLSTASGRPELTIANQLLIGSTAFAGDPLRADVNLGMDRLGTIVIPSAHISSSLSLTPQN
ncbi:MAG: hypothetical protein P1U78_09090 [Alcanivoracaceae bacterium]|nr:hypothetical protein [Alcanivoracaceae bacterium]